jgi:hypothetical protein
MIKLSVKKQAHNNMRAALFIIAFIIIFAIVTATIDRPKPSTIEELNRMERIWNSTVINPQYPFFTFTDPSCQQYDCVIATSYLQEFKSLTIANRNRQLFSEETVVFRLREDNTLMLYTNNMSGGQLVEVTYCLSIQFK